MFFKTIEKLQKKPEGVRRRVGFIAALVVTLIIFLAWLPTLGAKKDLPKQTGKDGNITPLATILRSTTQAMDDAFANFNNTRKGLTTEVYQAPAAALFESVSTTTATSSEDAGESTTTPSGE